MKCPSCNINPAVKDKYWGILSCQSCRDSQAEGKPGLNIEVTTEEIRTDRKIYKTDIRQPFRQGELSKEFVEEHPQTVNQMLKEGRITPTEVKNARKVWLEDEYYES